MSAQHTPGSWKVVWNGHFHEIVSEEGQIGDACSSQFINSAVKDTELAEANARLIAAAPELLEALVYIVDQMAQKENDSYTLKQYRHGLGFSMAKEAIAKAKG